MRQSPINIVTGNVEFDGDLVDLELSGWEAEYAGTFNNTGITTQFTPNTGGQVTTTNHLGTYELLNCHFHWGNRSGVGAEHTIDGNPGELEVHFVHRKRNAPEGSTAGNLIAVIAVIANVDNAAQVTGPWAQLNAAAIRAVDGSIDVPGFRFDQFLPTNREYYFYEGSLTAPLCNETAVWFIMREPISVPGAYLSQLRAVMGDDAPGGDENNINRPLTYNNRNLQGIGERVVRTNSQAIAKPVLAILALCLVLVAMF